MFRRRVLTPLFHSRVVSRPAPPTEAFVNEPPSLHPSLLLNRASPYQSYITAKRSARERQKGGGVDCMVDYSNVSIMPFHARNGERDAFCIGLLPL